MNTTNTKQSGFTLIELVVVIVILGILAAVALPKFVDLRSEANTAALDGVAGSMGAAMAINYGGCAAVNNVPATNKCVIINNCNLVGDVMQGGIPTGYTVGSVALATNGAAGTCVVTQTASTNTKNFSGVGAGI